MADSGEVCARSTVQILPMLLVAGAIAKLLFFDAMRKDHFHKLQSIIAQSDFGG